MKLNYKDYQPKNSGEKELMACNNSTTPLPPDERHAPECKVALKYTGCSL